MEKRTTKDSAGLSGPASALPAEQCRKAILEHFAAGDYRALSVAAQTATLAHPDEAFFWKALGVARSLLGEHGDSVIGPLTEAARRQPGDAEVFDGLAQALARVGRLEDALAQSLRAVTLAPGHAILQTNYGNVLAEAGRYREAIACHRKAVQLDPRLAIGWLNLGTVLRLIPWRHGEAAVALDQALTLNPDLQAAWDNLLYLRQYQSEALPLDILRESVSAAERLTRSIRPRLRRRAQPLVGRPLKVGLVSADLRDHPVGSGVLAVLPHLKAHAVDIVAYSGAQRPDQTSQRIAAQVSVWREVAGLTDDALADRIAEDGIDVLVDLSGRTRGHRLGVFARRAAPVQVCWLGWFSTSGLPQMDWYLGDRVTLPEAEAALFAERRWLIDGPYYVQTPRALTIPTEATVADGSIRFGCFNALAKLSTRTLDLWARILSAVPGATLFLKSREFADRDIITGLEQEFARRGVPASRLRLAGHSPLADYLQAFNEIDLSLDPTPYTGGATTFDSLWMGVPVLTLAGDRYIAHQGESLLGRLGMGDWIASDDASYVARAQAAAAQVTGLRQGRCALRARFLASSLVDGAALAAQLASAWHGMHADALNGPAPFRLPEDPVALEKTASILLHLEDWPAAQVAWQAVLDRAIEPVGRANALAHLAIALQGQQQFAPALAAYADALPMLGPGAVYGLNLNMGVCCRHLQRFDTALVHARAALQARPGDPAAQALLTGVLADQQAGPIGTGEQ